MTLFISHYCMLLRIKIQQPWFTIASFPVFRKLNADHVIFKLSICNHLGWTLHWIDDQENSHLQPQIITIVGIQHRPNSCYYNWGERVSYFVITAITFRQGAITYPEKLFFKENCACVGHQKLLWVAAKSDIFYSKLFTRSIPASSKLTM